MWKTSRDHSFNGKFSKDLRTRLNYPSGKFFKTLTVAMHKFGEDVGAGESRRGGGGGEKHPKKPR